MSHEHIILPAELARDILEELYELLGERNWWKYEPRCNYKRDYDQLCELIEALEKLIPKYDQPPK